MKCNRCGHDKWKKPFGHYWMMFGKTMMECEWCMNWQDSSWEEIQPGLWTYKGDEK